MAAIAVGQLRVAAAAAATVILVSVPACTGHAGTAPRPQSTASAASTPVDLSNVLVQPAGFEAMHNDVTSGPLQTPDEVRRFFTDSPGDPAEILSHGFVGGYVRAFQPDQNLPSNADAKIEETILLEIVIQFDTPAHAVAVEQYFRHAPAIWPVRSFAVPSQLTAGYGQYQVQGAGRTATYLYSVVWVSHNRLFNVGIDYSTPRRSADQVISVAVAQRRAGP
jgi:hypothetical protein